MTHQQALIVRGGWEGHQPVAATELFIPFLRACGFGVQIEESPAIYADPDAMAAVDLIVQCVTMSEITDDQVMGLRAAVAAGTGLTGWHGGLADSYRASSHYLQLVGGQFATHPSKEPAALIHSKGDDLFEPPQGVTRTRSKGHALVSDESDNFLTYLVNITDLGRRHPIMAELEDFELTTEQYWVLHDDLNDVLATTTHPAPPWHPWHRPITSPAVWTRLWGAGRIVVTTPGHSPAVLQNPSVRTIIERGMLWATRTGVGVASSNV